MRVAVIITVLNATLLDKKKQKTTGVKLVRKIATNLFNNKKFSSWLEMNKRNTNKGFCKVCSVEISGGLTHLERHKSSKKHKKNIKVITTTAK